MTYIAWTMFAEGSSDREYFEVLIPRILQYKVVRAEGPNAEIAETPVPVFRRSDRDLRAAAREACKAKDAFHVLFVHGDTGGREQEGQVDGRTLALCRRMGECCEFDCRRCVVVTPRPETEAWCLADQEALRNALGVSEGFEFIELPAQADQLEKLENPKQTTMEIMSRIMGRKSRKRRKFPYAVIAQVQDIETLNRLPAMREFEDRLDVALATLGLEVK